MQSAPPMALRASFLIAMFLPLYVYKTEWTPIVLSTFLLVSDNSFATSILPDGHIPYIIIVLILAYRQGKVKHIPIRPIAMILLIYTYIINTITGNTIDRTALYMGYFYLFAFPFFVKKNDEFFPHLFSYAFIVSSLTLSIILALFGAQFARSATLGNYESFTWKDTNYWSNVIAMGVVAALIELYNSRGNKRIRLFLWGVVATEALVLIVTASRGSILAVAAAFLFLFLSSNANKNTKIYTTIGVVIIVGVLFFSGKMDRLIFRIFEEDTFATGNGRVDIWTAKLEKFFRGDQSHRILGYGTEGGRKLGAEGTLLGLISTHNDFLSYLCYYGYIGLTLFLVLLYRPLMNIKSRNKTVVYSATAFITVSIFTLEPLAGGNIAWFAFLFYIYAWSQVSNASAGGKIKKLGFRQDKFAPTLHLR